MATPLHQNLSLWLLLLLSVCGKKFKLEAKFDFIKINKTNSTVSCLYLHNRGLFLNLRCLHAVGDIETGMVATKPLVCPEDVTVRESSHQGRLLAFRIKNCALTLTGPALLPVLLHSVPPSARRGAPHVFVINRGGGAEAASHMG